MNFLHGGTRQTTQVTPSANLAICGLCALLDTAATPSSKQCSHAKPTRMPKAVMIDWIAWGPTLEFELPLIVSSIVSRKITTTQVRKDRRRAMTTVPKRACTSTKGLEPGSLRCMSCACFMPYHFVPQNRHHAKLMAKAFMMLRSNRSPGVSTCSSSSPWPPSSVARPSWPEGLDSPLDIRKMRPMAAHANPTPAKISVTT
mmetsp:Transcript_41044/g.108429  ORF Transcript_41044/g.108429 Transcript_41044/m.108429 type:complete len:201 (-) Transcript_41044:889-1491(-)